VEAEATPLSSMLAKRKRPNQAIHDWQLKNYPRRAITGVVDGKDVTEHTHTARERVHAVAQKVWDNPGISDFADEAEVAGLSKGEMAEQIADSIVLVKRIIEGRCLSNEECSLDDGVNTPYETRGLGKWIQNGAQATYPVPASFRTPSAQVYSSTLAAFTEDAFNAMMQSAFKQRHGPATLDGFVGIELKAAISKFTRYDDTVSNKTVVRTFNQDAKDKAIISVIDRIVTDQGTVNLHPVTFLYLTEGTGEDSAYTHKSGFFVDMKMLGLAYTRMPRVRRLEDRGGGPRAIVDAIFMLMCDNPLGHMKAEISA
jgi:hypothetical protein